MNGAHPLELLTAYLDGELSLADRRTVERHVEGCAHCRARLADYRTMARAHGATIPAVPADLAARLAARLDEEAPAKVVPLAPRRRVAPWMYATAAGVLLAAFAGIVAYRTPDAGLPSVAPPSEGRPAIARSGARDEPAVGRANGRRPDVGAPASRPADRPEAEGPPAALGYVAGGAEASRDRESQKAATQDFAPAPPEDRNAAAAQRPATPPSAAPPPPPPASSAPSASSAASASSRQAETTAVRVAGERKDKVVELEAGVAERDDARGRAAPGSDAAATFGAARDEATRDEAAREQAAREQAAREQTVRVEAARETAARAKREAGPASAATAASGPGAPTAPAASGVAPAALPPADVRLTLALPGMSGDAAVVAGRRDATGAWRIVWESANPDAARSRLAARVVQLGGHVERDGALVMPAERAFELIEWLAAEGARGLPRREDLAGVGPFVVFRYL